MSGTKLNTFSDEEKKLRLRFVGITRLPKDVPKGTDVKLMNYFGIHLLNSDTKNV